ncbi:S-layer family protein [Nostoc sp. LEGE 12447]|uniref:S-layer family protein n=1 Tax=Nostoc sp. LEGE 12447 TaxID=1828640 RepID=UPI001883FC5D|nr:S-layer family protein [Nostoc sp. LEGE 12447]MBE9002036.1 S-layer family protein [Nostoc sp. LEGE 12447]
MSKINGCWCWFFGLAILMSSTLTPISILAQEVNLEDAKARTNSSFRREINKPNIFRVNPSLQFDNPWKFVNRTAWFVLNQGCSSLPLLIMTGRGGIPPSPTEPLIGDAIIINWITLETKDENRADDTHNKRAELQTNTGKNFLQKVNPVNPPTQIVEAQGLVVDANRNVFLVAQTPTVKLHSPLFTPVTCLNPKQR